MSDFGTSGPSDSICGRPPEDADVPHPCSAIPSNVASRRVAERIGLTRRGLGRSRPDRPPELAYAERDLAPETFPLSPAGAPRR
jgi:hypothetical protein